MDYRLPLLAQGPISFLTLSNLFSANRLRHGIAIIDESNDIRLLRGVCRAGPTYAELKHSRS